MVHGKKKVQNKTNYGFHCQYIINRRKFILYLNYNHMTQLYKMNEERIQISDKKKQFYNSSRGYECTQFVQGIEVEFI